MKKIISVVLALMMVLSMFTAVSAATVNDLLTERGFSSTKNLSLAVEVNAKKSTSAEYAATDLAITSSGAEGVDYKTTLNMGPIRTLFGSEAISVLSAGDDFAAGIVTTTVNVEIEYPDAAAIAGDKRTIGVLEAGSIFVEAGRAYDGNDLNTEKFTVTYNNTANLNAADLVANHATYFADIAFTLEDAVSYSAAGTYPVTVKLTGTTTIDFPSVDFVANYTGEDTHTTTYTAYTPGGNTRPASYTVTFNTNGGTEVSNVKVKRGDKLTAPTVTKEGYVFEGWYTDSALTIPFDFDTAITKNITLFAKWKEETKPVDPTPDVPKAPEDFDKFTDLDGYEWAETAINYLAYKDVIKGVTDTTYEPDLGIKRGEVALLMVRIFGLESDATDEFDDIEIDYYRDACRIGKDHGVLLGVNEDNTLYEPERIILREEMAALIVRSLVTMGHIDNPTDTDISMYVDAADTEAYAVPYIAYLTRMGIVQGDPNGEFRPKDTVTRAEAAQILYNLYKLDVEGLLD